MPDKQAKADSLTDEAVRKRQITLWVTVVASFFVLLSTGHFQYSFGVFVKPMIDTFGWSRTAISSIASVRGMLTALVSPFSGTLSDKYGSKKLLLLGISLFGLGFVLASRATTLWQFYLTFGILIGIGGGIVSAPAISSITKLFGRKSARASGVAMAGMSSAQIVFPPAIIYLISSYGWKSSLVIVGVITWLLGTFSWSFIKNPQQSKPATPKDITITQSQGDGLDFTLSEALHTVSFWILFSIYSISAICFQMVTVHIVVAAVDLGVTVDAAAIILTIMGVFNTLGRLVLSGLADRFGGRIMAAISSVLQAAALFVLASAIDVRVFYLTGAVLGLFYGTLIPMIPTLSGNYFGTRFAGSIFGMLNLAYLGGAAIGPLLAGYIFDVTGNYYAAFTFAALLFAVAFLLCLVLRLPQKRLATA